MNSYGEGYREVSPYEPRGGIAPIGFESAWCGKCGRVTKQIVWIDGLECTEGRNC
jgi:hypothetical protein